MRKFYLLPLALATVALGACSSDDATTTDGGKSSFADGGYMSLSINLPSTSTGLRAANDNFDDGLASEYAVNDATLILFSGETEAAATFHSAYDLTTSMADNSSAQITSTTRIVKKVNDTNSDNADDKLYALVILNDNGMLTIGSDASLTVNGTAFAGNFAEFQALTATASYNGDGFFMTNAPLSSVAGGASAPTGATITTLADVSTDVYNTEAEALANTAASIYVERGLAKVTMSNSEGTLSGDDYDEVKYTIDGWVLDNTNTSSYIVRNYDATWNAYASELVTTNPYRFIGANAVATGLYRTSWGTDPNTSKPTGLTLVGTSNLSTAFGSTNPQYCYENVTSVDDMDQDKVTRVVIRAKISSTAIGDDATFYTFNDDKTTLYTATTRNNRVKAAILNNQEVIDWAAENNLSIGSSSTFSITYSEVTTDDNGNITDPTIKVTAFTLTSGSLSYIGTADDVTAINNDVKTITQYTNGYAYYTAYIKHFGDDLTPWGEGKANVAYGNIYPAGETKSASENYLGRYGVLRNNWYDLSVTGIRALGDATIPERPNIPVDELDSYIAISINVLSWAKRDQSVEL